MSSHKSHIIRLGVPALLASVVEPVLSLSDAWIVGQIPEHSTIALAAVGLGSTLVSTIIWSIAQFRSAITAVVSRYLGLGRLGQLDRLLPQVLLLNLVIGLVLLVCTAPFTQSIFGLYSTTEQVYQAVDPYYKIRALGFPVILTVFVLFGVFRGIQNTTWSMYISVSGAVINIGLNYILVYGYQDHPDAVFASTQVALASVISQVWMLFLSLYFFVKKTPFTLVVSKVIHPEFKPIVLMVANLTVRTLSLNFVFHFSNYLTTRIGNSYIAAHSILVNLWLFTSFFMDGITSAAGIVSGKLMGQENYGSLRRLIRESVRIGLQVSSLLAIVYLMIRPWLASTFASDPEVIRLVSHGLYLVCLIQPIASIAYTYDATFKGLGWARTLRNTLVVSSFFIFSAVAIPLYYWGGLHLYAIWIGMIAWMVYRGFYLKYIFTKRLNTLEHAK